ncbi:MAG: DUF2849 domain-containing protein [Rhodospirillales bacterium]|nr:DUF2849 domain-containing protein [Rhodospirillales bacterium]HJO98001.1 DUF2849 domain-containing protein [Rhodospirillales bacterium]
MIVTANRLHDGAVVYQTADGGWSLRLGDAHDVTKETEAEELIANTEADVAACRVVEPYAMTVEKAARGLKPVSQRERIRARGPTVPYGHHKPRA